jgi:hypothetical protein
MQVPQHDYRVVFAVLGGELLCLILSNVGDATFKFADLVNDFLPVLAELACLARWVP